MEARKTIIPSQKPLWRAKAVKPFKIIGYWYLRWPSNYVAVGGSNSTYLLIPDKAKAILKDLGVALEIKKSEAKDFDTFVEVITGEGGIPQLVFSFEPKATSKSTMETQERQIKRTEVIRREP